MRTTTKRIRKPFSNWNWLMTRQTAFIALATVLVLGTISESAHAQQGLTNRAGSGTGAATVGGGQGLNDSVQFGTIGENFGNIGTTQGESSTTRVQGSQLANQQGAGGGGTTTTRSTNRSFGGTGGGFGRTGGNLGRTGNTGGFNPFAQGGVSNTRTIRPSLRLGFTPILRPATEVNRLVTRRFASISNRISALSTTQAHFQGINITVADKGIVTLKGSVASEDAKRLAANILRMEPGVRSVKNELVVKELAQK
jgi:hypothetical protein